MHKLRLRIHCRQAVLDRKTHNLLLVVLDESKRDHDESVCTPLPCGSEGIPQIVRTSHLQRLKLHPQRTGGHFGLLELGGGGRTVRVPEYGYARGRRNNLFEKLQPFTGQVLGDVDGAGNIPTRSRKTGNQSVANRIISEVPHHDRDRTGRLLGGSGR